MKSKIFILLISLLLSACFSARKGTTTEREESGSIGIDSLCESLEPFSSLYINKVKASISLEGEVYDAKVNLFYIPDSVIFLTAANTGFEIVRAALTPDSLVFINRIDKVVYIHKESELGYKAPAEFKDLEHLINKTLVCNSLEKSSKNNEEILFDFSAPNIDKKITRCSNSLKMSKFEFFHKKTGEYIVGEAKSNDTITVYSNYLFEDVEIVAVGGELNWNEEVKVDISFNKNKYLLISD
ncbi:DUF4292 domain-containing protein [Bacteroidota bacterium]